MITDINLYEHPISYTILVLVALLSSLSALISNGFDAFLVISLYYIFAVCLINRIRNLTSLEKIFDKFDNIVYVDTFDVSVNRNITITNSKKIRIKASVLESYKLVHNNIIYEYNNFDSLIKYLSSCKDYNISVSHQTIIDCHDEFQNLLKNNILPHNEYCHIYHNFKNTYKYIGYYSMNRLLSSINIKLTKISTVKVYN